MGTLHEVCERKDLAQGQGRSFSVAGRSIAVFHVGGRYYAVEDHCTHEGGPLGEGVVEGTRVLCPWHGAEFDLVTGEALSPPADHAVSCFRVVVEGDTIKVEVP